MWTRVLRKIRAHRRRVLIGADAPGPGWASELKLIIEIRVHSAIE
jgi:hypothetical protein